MGPSTCRRTGSRHPSSSHRNGRWSSSSRSCKPRRTCRSCCCPRWCSRTDGRTAPHQPCSSRRTCPKRTPVPLRTPWRTCRSWRCHWRCRRRYRRTRSGHPRRSPSCRCRQRRVRHPHSSCRRRRSRPCSRWCRCTGRCTAAGRLGSWLDTHRRCKLPRSRRPFRTCRSCASRCLGRRTWCHRVVGSRSSGRTLLPGRTRPPRTRARSYHSWRYRCRCRHRRRCRPWCPRCRRWCRRH